MKRIKGKAAEADAIPEETAEDVEVKDTPQDNQESHTPQQSIENNSDAVTNSNEITADEQT